jgi:hypothetical protein
METIGNNYLGLLCVNGGSILNSAGAIVNCLGDHNSAYLLWMIGNPLLLLWAIGYVKSWWNGNLSMKALIEMYAIFIAGNIYAIWKFVI